MLLKILNAGSGGQGVLTMGNILGNAAMLADYHVTYLPEYGAAMRGGTANCTISISDEDIASPIASVPDIIVAMNQPSVLKFIARMISGGQMIYNADLVDTIPERGDVMLYGVHANKIAHDLGSERSANMVILGSLVKLIAVVDPAKVEESMEMMMGSKKKLLDMSIRAFRSGYEMFENSHN